MKFLVLIEKKNTELLGSRRMKVLGFSEHFQVQTT